MAELKTKSKSLSEQELLDELENAAEATKKMEKQLKDDETRYNMCIGYELALKRLLDKMQTPEKSEKKGDADSGLH